MFLWLFCGASCSNCIDIKNLTTQYILPNFSCIEFTAHVSLIFIWCFIDATMNSITTRWINCLHLHNFLVVLHVVGITMTACPVLNLLLTLLCLWYLTDMTIKVLTKHALNSLLTFLWLSCGASCSSCIGITITACHVLNLLLTLLCLCCDTSRTWPLRS